MKKEYPLVSIVIANYNGKHFLKNCLDSLLKTQYPAEKREAIVVDNGSNDDSIKFIKKYYPSVVILKNDVNNYARANNLGIKAAKGEFIALANNDLVFDKAWLKELTKVISTDKKIGAVMGKVLFPDGKLQGTGHYDLPNFYWSDRGFRETDVGQYDKIEDMQSISHCAVLYRKACLKDVGPLDEDFNMYVEDVDMAIRARDKGWRLLYVPRGRVHHKFHGTATEEGVGFFCERNRLLLVAKHYPKRLPEALFGKGYFTALNNRHDFFKVLPEVIRKLITSNDSKTATAVWPSFFESLNRISNVEKEHIVKQLDSLNKVLTEKNELLSQREQALRDEQSRAEALRQKIEAEGRALQEHKIAFQQALLEEEKKGRKTLEDAIRAREEDAGRFRTELEAKNQEMKKQLQEIETQAGKISQYEILEKELRAQQALWEANLASQKALLEEQLNKFASLETALHARDEELGRSKEIVEEKNREAQKILHEMQTQSVQLKQYEQLEKEFKLQQALLENNLASQKDLFAEERKERKALEGTINLRDDEIVRCRKELEAKDKLLREKEEELQNRSERLAQYGLLEKDLRTQMEMSSRELSDQRQDIEAAASKLLQYDQLEKMLRADVESKFRELTEQRQELEARAVKLAQYGQLEKDLREQLTARDKALGEQGRELEARAGRLTEYDFLARELRGQLEARDKELGDQGRELEARAGRLAQYELLEKDLRERVEAMGKELGDQGRELEARAMRLTQFEILERDLHTQVETMGKELGDQGKELEVRAGQIEQYELMARDLRTQLEARGKELGDQGRELEARSERLAQYEQLERDLRGQIEAKNRELEDRWRELEGKNGEIGNLSRVIEDKNRELGDRWRELEGKKGEIGNLSRIVDDKNRELGDRWRELEGKKGEIGNLSRIIDDKNRELGDRWREVEAKNRDLAEQWSELQARAERLRQYEFLEKELREQQFFLENTISAREEEASRLKTKLEAKEKELQEQFHELGNRAEELKRYKQMEQDFWAQQAIWEEKFDTQQIFLEEERSTCKFIRAELEKKLQEIGTLDANLIRAITSRDALQKEKIDFYASNSFRYFIGPVWRMSNRLKQLKQAILLLGKRPKKVIDTREPVLFIKPQRVSVEEAKGKINEYKTKYPRLNILALANLTKEDYERMHSDPELYVDEKYFYSPGIKRFGFFEKVKFVFKMRRKKIKETIVLAGAPIYRGYKLALILAFMTGAKRVEVLRSREGADPEIVNMTKEFLAQETLKDMLLLPFRSLLVGVLVVGFLVFIVGGIQWRKLIRQFRSPVAK